MRPKIAAILCIPAMFLIIAAAFALAQETGTISGTILDSQTQRPLVGASVFLVGTSRGANTDIAGRFVIKSVPPGNYALKITALGYTTLELKDVEVKTDLTREIKTSLTPAAEGIGEQIVVEAEVDIIDKFETSGKTTITKETNGKKPAETVDELMGKVAGVVSTKDSKIFIRGGRALETTHELDGVPKDHTAAGSGGIVANLNPVPVTIGDSVARVNRAPANKNKARREAQNRRVPYFPENPYGQTFDDMFFENYGTNPFINTENDYQSTFAIDIDDASYALCRSYLEKSTLPPKDAIRVEEFINHFDYKYQVPSRETFNVYMEGAPSRFGQNTQLLRIGLQGKKIDIEGRKPANIVFVVDVSGSMNEGNRYDLVIETLKHIINRSYVSDMITIVSYNQNAQLILNPTSLRHKDKIIEALDQLFPHGSTNVQAGLCLGYKMASRNFDPSRNNCLLLFSDGVANVGEVNAENLLNETKKYAKKGITLSAIGVGMGNYNDVLLEKLGDKGDGFYAYIDDIEQARRVFDGNLAGALQVIAKDVKIQVEFDPEVVQSYRLLGYENRAVADYQFRNDQVDGGEIGPAHAVTALYEIRLKNVPNSWYDKAFHNKDIGRVYIRYKNPQTGTVEEINKSIIAATFQNRFTGCTTEFKLAVCAAEFAEIMRDSYWAKNSNLEDVLQLAKEVYRESPNDDVLELVNLVSKARQLRSIESDYFSRE